MKRSLPSWIAQAVCVLALSGTTVPATQAQESPVSPETDEQSLPHGPTAPGSSFPSHRFSRRAHQPQRVQLSFHYGLLQPIVLKGFNAAIDVRYRRFIFTYSHGQGLDFTGAPGVRSSEEKAAGETVFAPFSTGFGLGCVIVDELYALVDFKVHKFQVRLDETLEEYLTMTVGLEVGYRFFIWRGLHIAPVLRYWPNVWTSAKHDPMQITSSDHSVTHHVVQQGTSGFFANVLLGWAFSL